MAKNRKQVVDALDKMLAGLGDPTSVEPETLEEDLTAPVSLAELTEVDEAEQTDDELIASLTAKPEPVKSKQAAQVVTSVPPPTPVVDNTGIMLDVLKRTIAEHDTVGDQILGKWKADNEQLQTVINIFLEQVRDGDRAPAREVVEGLVQLLGTKAKTSMTAVKYLESKTKLLAAMKGNINIINSNSNSNDTIVGTNAELTDLLSGPIESDLDG